jgi:glycosyltransferase involved in cell wall biosynthesis
MPGMDAPRLSIIIPALNEEEAIGETIRRCLAARQYICEGAGLSDVEILIVSDGSTDRTAEIAHGFDEVSVIEFPQNRGYGAAIKEGWRQGSGSLLAFLDADGTCDPRHFAEMCRLLLADSADVVLGSRLGPDSKMPRVRRIGNQLYAFLLGFLCGRHVTDTASGMRVVRRSSLRQLYPLPNGLHFTPSMSARALLNDLRVIETPISYDERTGESKLSVVRDGVRFLQTIFDGVLCYRPERLLLCGVTASLMLVLLMALHPIEHYFSTQRVEEWMIYRFVVCHVLGSFALLLLLATALSNEMASFGPRRREATPFWPALISVLLRWPAVGVLIGVLCTASVLFLWPGIVEFVSTRTVQMHWSRLIVGAFTVFSAAQTAVFALLMKVISIWQRERESGRHAESDSPPLSIHSASGVEDCPSLAA